MRVGSVEHYARMNMMPQFSTTGSAQAAERAANSVPMIDIAEITDEFRGLTGHIRGPGLRKFSRKPMARPLATLYRLIWRRYFASRYNAGRRERL